jgi:FkbM family methyltransferase
MWNVTAEHIRSSIRVVKRVRNAIALARAQRVSVELRWRRGGPQIVLLKGNRELRLPVQHAMYVPDVAQEFDLYFSAVVPRTESSRLVVDHSRPGWHELSGQPGVRVWLPSFTEGAAYVDTYLSLLNLRTGDAVLDLGANCGLFTIACAKLVGPTGLVIAVEPDPGNCEALRRNVAEAKLDNVRVMQVAAWSADGWVSFGADGSMGALVLSGAPMSRGKRVQVPSRTVDSLAGLASGRRLAAVKMDIEGAEYEAIKGATGVWKKPLRLGLWRFTAMTRRPSVQTDCGRRSPRRSTTSNYRPSRRNTRIRSSLPPLADRGGQPC